MGTVGPTPRTTNSWVSRPDRRRTTRQNDGHRLLAAMQNGTYACARVSLALSASGRTR